MNPANRSASAPYHVSRRAPAAKVGPAKVGPAKTGPAKTGPAKTGPQKPHLQVASEPPRKFRKLFVTGITLGLLGMVAIPFVIVFIHASLLAGQRDLDHLRQDLNAQLELRQELLFERSLAVSPQRIITIARDQLGMVSAENIVYLQQSEPAVS